MGYQFKAVRRFWKSLNALPPRQRESAINAFRIFKEDPFDFRLRTHKVQKLSAIAKHTIFSAEVEGDLRVVFRIDDDTVTTLDIGDHSVYR